MKPKRNETMDDNTKAMNIHAQRVTMALTDMLNCAVRQGEAMSIFNLYNEYLADEVSSDYIHDLNNPDDFRSLISGGMTYNDVKQADTGGTHNFFRYGDGHGGVRPMSVAEIADELLNGGTYKLALWFVANKIFNQ